MSRFGLVPFYRNSAVADVFDQFDRALFNSWPSVHTFRTDIKDNGDSLSLQAELPGVPKEDLDIQVNGDVLTITVQRNEEKEEQAETYLHRERISGSCSRSFDISGIEVEKISAAYQDGVLTLELPKQKDAKPTSHKIDVA